MCFGKKPGSASEQKSTIKMLFLQVKIYKQLFIAFFKQQWLFNLHINPGRKLWVSYPSLAPRDPSPSLDSGQLRERVEVRQGGRADGRWVLRQVQEVGGVDLGHVASTCWWFIPPIKRVRLGWFMMVYYSNLLLYKNFTSIRINHKTNGVRTYCNQLDGF